jgi:DNA-binding phage protein
MADSINSLKNKVIDLKKGKAQIQKRRQALKPGNLRDDDLPFETKLRVTVNAKVRDYVNRSSGKVSTREENRLLRELAIKSGLTLVTIKRMAYYETARPMLHTAAAICDALNINLKVD